jgi:uncharacterized protein (DUF427 family)
LNRSFNFSQFGLACQENGSYLNDAGGANFRHHLQSIIHTQCETSAVKLPGPDHPITITPNGKRVRVTFAGNVIADTARALLLKEASYKPVFYIPRADADMSLLTPTDNRTHCPYKGDASYFTIAAHGRSAENAVWSYEQPFPAMAEIKEYLAFYPNRVDTIEEI